MIMKKKLANILSEIDLEIDEIDLYGYDIIPVSLAMVHRLQGILSDLRNDLQTYVFPSKEEEIYFFKNQKPELLGRLLYFHKIYRIEVQCPTGSNDVIRLYLNKELDSLTYFFNRNLDFYQYYRSHSTVHDELYFLRGKVDFRLCTDSAQFDKDPNFSTGYDYKVAKILANEMLRIYLNKKLQKLECDSYIEEKQAEKEYERCKAEYDKERAKLNELYDQQKAARKEAFQYMKNRCADMYRQSCLFLDILKKYIPDGKRPMLRLTACFKARVSTW